ncbi:uncharacterized protein LOC115666619 isoform X1 [Syzygium oleosum]|uniref:uncharacterized protein LOC115666619 isoform X1 n=1 Tax=Syzygium oleosum TaxID=219896 RepID=UPI0024B8D1DC|nr:uncharacterized protein LOC115666619 isoform X1 [Syzygium oleosum]
MEKILWYLCSIFSTKDVSVQRQLRVLPLVWLVVSILASFQRFNMILETLIHRILSLTASFHCLGDTLSQIYTMHREAIYKIKCRSDSPDSFPAQVLQGNEAQTDNFIEMYLRPPSASEEARINDWIKVRQSGIRYYLSLGDQRIVDKHFIIRPKAEFEVRNISYFITLNSRPLS